MELPNTQTHAMLVGARKYRTGKACKHGHISDRWTLTANCCACTIERVNKRREAFKLAVDRRAEA